MRQDNVRYMYVSNYTGATALSHGDRLKEVDNLNDGEMVVVNAMNNVLTENNIGSDDLAANDGVIIAFRNGDQIYRTPKLKKDNLLGYTGVSYSSNQNQITYMGYDGSGNSLTGFTGGTLVTPRVEFYEDTRQGQGNQTLETTAYEVQSNDTQMEVALGIANALQKTFNRKQHKPIKTECLTSNTTTSAPSNSLTVYNGSQWVETDETLSSGQVVRIGGQSTSDPVYKLLSVDNTAGYHKLDRPYEGADATNGTGSWEYMSESNASSADWGVKFTGLDKKFKKGKFPYGVYRFDVNAGGLSGTVIANSQDAKPGAGEGKEMVEKEWFYQGNMGNTYRRDFLHEDALSVAKEDNDYDQLSIRCYNDQETSAVGYVQSPIEVVLAFKTGFTSGQSPDVVLNAL
ncbi:hypothetical protein, partial [Methanohalobium sp.]|uniref:hypothetical protein n=1 Tax=Methanohalobium sp. TaxID=2837493 RepID=UPI0025ED6519